MDPAMKLALAHGLWRLFVDLPIALLIIRGAVWCGLPEWFDLPSPSWRQTRSGQRGPCSSLLSSARSAASCAPANTATDNFRGTETMAFLIDSQRKWLKEHGDRTESGGWICKETRRPINFKSFEHSTPNPCFGVDDFLKGHDGNPINRTVLMLYCTACDKEPKRLPYDARIVEVAG